MARRRSRRGKKTGTWLVLGAAAVGAYFLLGQKSASAATKEAGQGQPGGPTGQGPVPTDNPPAPAPGGGIAPGPYMVSTRDTGPSGQLAMRAEPSLTSDPPVEWLAHGAIVTASGQVQNGFAAVMAQDGKTGWSSLSYLTPATAQ